MTKSASEMPQSELEPGPGAGSGENRSQGQESAGMAITARDAMPDTNEQIDAVKEARELLQRITQGVRVASGNGVHIGTHCVAIAYAPNTFTVTDEVKANAELYARAPELLKTLCDELDRLRNQQKVHAEMVDDYYGSR